MDTVFAPGCALLLYKPKLAENIFQTLEKLYPRLKIHTTCCHHNPSYDSETLVINVCPGCDRRYRSLYEGISTISLWEILDSLEDIALPDYKGMKVTVLDACPTRTETRVHKTVRGLLDKMNIEVTEPEHTGTRGKCCGDTFYGKLPKEQVIEKMRERAEEMPQEHVAVYCVSCVKSMKNGGRTPLYLPDLLFGEKTIPGECDPDIWHSQVNELINRR